VRRVWSPISPSRDEAWVMEFIEERVLLHREL